MTRAVIMEMLDSCADITEALRSALVTVEGSSNTFGDSQLSVDVVADEIMWVSMATSVPSPPSCHAAASGAARVSTFTFCIKVVASPLTPRHVTSLPLDGKRDYQIMPHDDSENRSSTI